MNNYAINKALELGLVSCLKCIQRSNPSILLTTSQLKRTERDATHIPAASLALASLISNCNDTFVRNSIMRQINKWDQCEDQESDANVSKDLSKETSVIHERSKNQKPPPQAFLTSKNQHMIARSIETRFRTVIEQRQDYRAKKEHTRTNKQTKRRKIPEQKDVNCGIEKDLHEMLPQEATEGNETELLQHKTNELDITYKNVSNVPVPSDTPKQRKENIRMNDDLTQSCIRVHPASSPLKQEKMKTKHQSNIIHKTRIDDIIEYFREPQKKRDDTRITLQNEQRNIKSYKGKHFLPTQLSITRGAPTESDHERRFEMAKVTPDHNVIGTPSQNDAFDDWW